MSGVDDYRAHGFIFDLRSDYSTELPVVVKEAIKNIEPERFDSSTGKRLSKMEDRSC